MLTEHRRGDGDYFFDASHEAAWRPELRRLLLARFDAQSLEARRRNGTATILIKEPAGSQAAELLLSLLPESRLLFLLRDGRDVLDSELDAVADGGWLTAQFGGSGLEPDERLRFLAGQAHRWVARTRAVQRAYERHDPALRLKVRYEDLVADTEAGVTEILGWMGAEIRPDAIRAHVERLSFNALPTERRGTGKFARAATPGLWRANLGKEEQALLHHVMGDTLREVGYDVDC
jgi:hypothetical protein